MEKNAHFPKADRISIISAVILIAYAGMPFIHIPAREIKLSLFNFLIAFQLNFPILISFIAAVLAAAGTNWLLQDHPALGSKTTLPYLITPTLTAWVLGIPLSIINVSLEWWVVFGLGGIFTLTVLIAEYIVVDPSDVRFPPAVMLLTALSFGLFLTLTIALRTAGLRLYMLLIILLPTYTFFCLRMLYLKEKAKWHFEWTLVCMVILSQCIIGLHYWPISPIRFGLILLGPAYSLVSIAKSLIRKIPLRNAAIEPVIMSGLFWTIAVLLA
ncbi:MAG TPA: hypothetical protein G4N92_03930 [Anaerolineae bacterium]|nr:hypothetical protein [Anaerolineae bacterium]